jgi:hypothetical protein
MSKRSDTCIGTACPFYKRYREACPNFVEGEWETTDGHKYTTKDCAPKRSMILTQQIYDMMIVTRKDYGHVRRAMIDVAQLACLNTGVELIEGQVEEPKLIEDQSNHGKDSDQ